MDGYYGRLLWSLCSLWLIFQLHRKNPHGIYDSSSLPRHSVFSVLTPGIAWDSRRDKCNCTYADWNRSNEEVPPFCTRHVDWPRLLMNSIFTIPSRRKLISLGLRRGLSARGQLGSYQSWWRIIYWWPMTHSTRVLYKDGSVFVGDVS